MYIQTPTVRPLINPNLFTQICKPYTSCDRPYYTIYIGSLSGYEDNVCGTVAQCESTEYKISDAMDATAVTAGTNTVCQQRVICSSTEYISSMGNGTMDDTCQTKTICSEWQMFSIAAAMDAIDENTPGVDTDCRNFSKCDPGYSVFLNETDTADRTCIPCPAGSYGTDGLHCIECLAGSYNQVINSKP